MTPAQAQTADYDVAILGSHFAPAILAAILARQGVRVLLADAEGDRTEPSGETTVPYTSEVFRLLADRFGVPEIGAFAHFTDLPDEIRAASGTKENISFLYHQPGVPQDPRQVVQFNVPGEHTEWHVNRPAAEEYLRRVAARYGARRVAGDPVVTGVGLTPDGTVITLSSGDDFRCRYVVDASGPSSVLLASQGVAIRSDARRLRSRVLATRMTRVRPLERCLRLSDYPGATPWSAGTVSHLFPGGWIQVVPFSNHSEARNALCGVTAAVDPDRFADLPADPQQAFALLTERFPTIAAQFTGSEPTEPWRDAQPWQRSAALTSGAQWFAMERSAARTEELLSRDVTMATEVVHALAAAMLRILRDGSPAAAEFERVARFQEALIDFNDRMLAAARTACRDFALWNAFSRVWLLWQILADLSLKRARMDSGLTWEPVDDLAAGALWFRTPAGLSTLLSQFFREMEGVDSGSVSPGTAARRIFRMLAKAPFVPPLYRFADPRARYYRFTYWRRLMMLLWVKTIAPRDFRRLLTRDNVTARRLPPVTSDEPCRVGSTGVDFNS